MQAKAWQQLFSESLFSGLDKDLSTTFASIDADERQLRFAVYQNNVFYSLSQALSDLYPVVKQLVGDDFFNGLAQAYIRQYPPSRAAMVYFGEGFSEFLANFEHAQSLPYLVDIAALELARHQSYHAADEVVLSAGDFATIEAAAFEQATLKLQASFKLISSAFPIFSIWDSHQQNSAATTIELNEPQWVLIVRHDYQLQTFNVDPGTYRFYHGLDQGLSVADAVTYAVEACDYDIAAAIHLGIGNGFFSDAGFLSQADAD
ncbi:MAG: DNA-binding domain-containing protein [Pseudomonadota bacterium]